MADGRTALAVATWNVHRCIGLDGRHDPERSAAVLAELGADVVGLQEVDSHPHVEHGLDQIDYLARATGLAAVRGPTLTRHTGSYGNALLTRRPVRDLVLHDVSVEGREPRGVIDAWLDAPGGTVRVLVTHFGLSRRERRHQVARLLAILATADRAPTLLLGDLNEWLPWSRLLAPLDRALAPARAPRTFPSRWPALRLDRIWVRPAGRLRDVRAHRSRLARVASDHLPVVGRLETGPDPAA